MSGLNINQSASAKSPNYRTGSDILTHEQFPNLIRDAINEQIDEMFEMFSGNVDSMQLKSLFLEKSQKGMIHRVQTKVRPNGTTPLRRDADDDIDMISAGEGFGYTFRTYMYGQGVSWERQLMELDDVGAIAEKFSWLTENSERTVKYSLADVMNRAINPTNAPVLCLDGMYLIDSDRPNPDPRAPKWSNEETTADITEDALFAAKLNAHNTIGPNGELLRLKVKKMYIPQAYELVAWKLANSQKEVGNANNTANWAAGNFPFEVMDDLTTNSIFYVLDDTKSEKNGLQIRWRVRPSLADIKFQNPDVEGKRIRFGFGLGCLDPRYVWRGGLLNAL
jgi:hypothetical protein